MPTKSVKSKSVKTRKPAVKKKAAAAPSKPAAKKAAKTSRAPAQPSYKRGFMWKLLQEKQAQQKLVNGHIGNTANPTERILPRGSQNGFARFNGPRRKAA